MKEALTTGEVAKYCGVNFRTVIRWIEKGYMKAYKLPGRGDNRVPIDSLIDFLKQNNMPIPAELQAHSASSQPGATAPTTATSIQSETTKSNAEKQQSTESRILIIEDEELMSKSIARTLKRRGYKVDQAMNGIEAGIRLERFEPQLITLDLQMPGMSGFDVLEALKANKQYAHIKVVIISAATKTKVLEVMKLGVDDVLEKPFKSEELLAKIEALLPIED